MKNRILSSLAITVSLITVPLAAQNTKPAAPKAAAPALPARGRVEKPVAPPPKTARPAPTFAGELPIEYEQLVTDLGAPRRRLRSSVLLLPLWLLAAGQGFLGALSPAMKRRIDASVSDRRFFHPQLATAANIFLNLVLYPIACVAVAVAGRQLLARLKSAFGGLQHEAVQEFTLGPADTSGGFGKVVLLRFPAKPGRARLQVRMEDAQSRKRPAQFRTGVVGRGRRRDHDPLNARDPRGKNRHDRGGHVGRLTSGHVRRDRIERHVE